MVKPAVGAQPHCRIGFALFYCRGSDLSNEFCHKIVSSNTVQIYSNYGILPKKKASLGYNEKLATYLY